MTVLVACCFNTNELKRKNCHIVENLLAYNGSDIKFIEVDLNQSLFLQGDFDIIFHRMLSLVIKSKNGDDEAEKALANIQSYVKLHPTCQLIDDFGISNSICDRFLMFSMLQKMCQQESFGLGEEVVVPEFKLLSNPDDVLQMLQDNTLQLPLICKPAAATSLASSRAEHNMKLVFDKSSISDLSGTSYVVQNFVNHNAVLFKLFTVGSHLFVERRSSIKNVHETNNGQTMIGFNTKDVAKGPSTSELVQLDEKEKQLAKMTQPDQEVLGKIARACNVTFKADFLGIDVIIDAKTGQYAILDVNYFPLKSLENFDDFIEVLIDYFRKRRL